MTLAARLAGNHVAKTSRRCDVEHVVGCLPSTVTARLAALQSSSRRPAERSAAPTDHLLGRRPDDGGGGGRGQQRSRRAPDAGHSTSSTYTSRLYDHQVQPTHQPGVGETPNAFLSFRRYVCCTTLAYNCLAIASHNCQFAMRLSLSTLSASYLALTANEALW